MKDTIQGLTMEQIEKVIQIFNPCMDDYMYIMDLKNDYYRISKHATERFMLPDEAFYDATQSHAQFVYKDDYPALNEDLNLILEGKKKSHNLHYRWLDKSGVPVWINCRGQVLDDEDGNPCYLIGCINETGKKQRADNTTGLLGESALASYSTPYSENFPSDFIIRIGIDDFVSINGDTGMRYSDYVLKNVADCIRKNLRDKQYLFHIVADEFIILDFNSKNSEDAVALYENIKKNISAFIDAENYKAVFTISAGITDTSSISGDYEYFMKLSEFALKRAKDSGKNSCYIFNQNDYDSFLRKRLLTTKLHHAVDNDFEGFEAFFQPIVDCKTYRLLGSEALMRFSIPSESGDGIDRISPVEFIPILEETGLIIPAGRWMLNQAISMCSEMQEHVPGFKVNINISYVQVIKSDILADILDTMKRYNLPPECIGIEMTESGYIESNSHFLSLWDALKDNKINLIIDDFGTGYSNLHCLCDLNPSYIKLDRYFTNKAMNNTYDHELMVKIIEMAHSLNLQICVEGVEKSEELDDIRKIEADYIQGYLFGKPYCKAEFYDKFI